MDERRELERLHARLDFQARVDEFLEAASIRRASLAQTFGELLPLIGQALRAERVWVEAFDEDLAPRTYGAAPGDPGLSARALPGRTSSARVEVEGGVALLRRLDVAGEAIGVLGVELSRPLPPGDPDGEVAHLEAVLEGAAEQLDDHLSHVRQARQKQLLLRAVHGALRHPIVHEGVRLAVERMSAQVQFDLMIVLYHLQEDYTNTLHYLVFRGKELEFRTGAQVTQELDRLLRGTKKTTPGGAPLLVRDFEFEHRRVSGDGAQRRGTTRRLDLREETQTDELLETLGYRECVENVLIAGLDDEAVVGKLVIASRRALTPHERDIVQLFADVLQKRIVDYNEAAALLHRSFSIPTVLRLLDEERPLARLTPRSADISILFADVAGFTSLSERCLKDPAAVSAFIEVWARGVTQIVWEHGGVFDKLVGDCVIALFGPPYFDVSPAERAAACARAAVDMARFTRALIDDPVCAPIKAAGLPLGVATGLNDCPASVGLFGPDQDYTAFSSGMNNTARLQGMATRDEVLVMAPMKATLEAANVGLRFGERREGKAKNVAEPLVFHALDVDSVR